ncbi:MAG: hypothetical protein ACKVZH_06650 [Blastocatellia bacterium]
MTSGNWLAGNWWQVLSALVLFASQVAFMAKAIQTINLTLHRVDELERRVESHQLATSLHRSPDFDLRIQNIEHGTQTNTQLLVQLSTDVAVLIKQTS